MSHYGTIEELSRHWQRRGYMGNVSGAVLVKASIFVDGLGWRLSPAGIPVPLFPGRPASATQVLQWPRLGAVDAYGNALAEGAVPGPVERATYEAAWYEVQSAGALNAAVRADQRVVREKFDVIEFQYADAPMTGSGLSGGTPVIPAVMAILAPVLTGGGRNTYGITGVVA